MATFLFQGTHHVLLSMVCDLADNSCLGCGTAVPLCDIRSQEHLSEQGTHMVRDGQWKVMFKQKPSEETFRSDHDTIRVTLREKLSQLLLLFLALHVTYVIFGCNVSDNVSSASMQGAYVAATHRAECKMLAFPRFHNAAEFGGVVLQKHLQILFSLPLFTKSHG